MLWYICMLLTIAFLVLTARCVFNKSLGKRRMFRAVLYCLVAAYVLYLPMLLSEMEPIVAILGGILNALRVITMDTDFVEYAEVIRASIPVAPLAEIYYGLLTLVHLLLPAISAMTALTVITRYLAEARLKALKRRKQPLHVFSELNYRSILLARSIRAHDQKCDILFLDDADGSDYTDLKQELHCNVITEQIQNIKARSDKRKICYYCISENREDNLNAALAIVSWLQDFDPAYQKNNHVCLFTTDPTAELIMDSVQKGRVDISIIDHNRTAVYQLLQQYPLPKYAVDGKVHVLICGFGPVGKALLRATAWAGQLADHDLRITVLGKDIENDIVDFRTEFSDFFCERYDIRLFSYENRQQYLQLLRDQAADANYLVVTEEDSEMATETAIRLRRFYYKEDPAYKNAPPLFCYMENEDKARAVAALQTAEAKPQRRMSYNITPFGTAAFTYSYENITDSPLENLSKNVHLVYEDIFSDGPVDVEAALERYNLFEVNKSSNMANALHIRYKLLMLGLDYTDDPNAEPAVLEEYLSTQTLETLTRVEHDRWMAFLDSEGWEGATVDQSKAYQASGISKGRHNCPLLKLHPYICAFDDLTQCSEALGLPDSTVYDREMIIRIPDILHDKWGVMGRKYTIIKTNDQSGT